MQKPATNYSLKRLLPLSTVAIFAACIEPFTPDPSISSKVLVVDGFISDSEGPYTIRLSRSAPLHTQAPTAESGALVSVKAEDDATVIFSETSPGVYQSGPTDFTGKIGTAYTLTIRTADGSQYLSNTEILKRVPPIDSIYFEPSGRYEEGTGDTLTGVALLVDTHDDQNSTRYYRWEWEETWEIRVPYPNTYDWVRFDSASKDGVLVLNDKKIWVCFSSAPSQRIHYASTRQLAQDRISKYELNYVDTRDYKLRSLYSINVKQYALDENEFRYWQQLGKTSESLGTLFDPQPYEIRGNVYNPEDLDEPVLGYFSASSISEKRLFIDRRQLQEIKYPETDCEQELVDVEFRYVFDYLQAGYLVAFLGPFGASSVFMAPAPCCDCRYHGTLEKPNFWPQ